MSFKPLLPESKTRKHGTPPAGDAFFRDVFPLTTWLALGALLQSAAFLSIGRLAVLPVACYLTFCVARAYAMTTGLIRNPHMDNVILQKFSAQLPDSNGNVGPKPADSDVAVLLIGVQCNSALGVFASGYNEIGDYFERMVEQVEKDPEQWGYLSSSQYSGLDRSSNNEVMSVMYFKSADDVHRYAESPLHRDAWSWWNKTIKQHPHIAIYHELYHVPKGHYETIYLNHAPSLMARSQCRVVREGPEGSKEEAWVGPVVDATMGVLASSAGRMGRQMSEKEVV